MGVSNGLAPGPGSFLLWIRIYYLKHCGSMEIFLLHSMTINICAIVHYTIYEIRVFIYHLNLGNWETHILNTLQSFNIPVLNRCVIQPHIPYLQLPIPSPQGSCMAPQGSCLPAVYLSQAVRQYKPPNYRAGVMPLVGYIEWPHGNTGTFLLATSLHPQGLLGCSSGGPLSY